MRLKKFGQFKINENAEAPVKSKVSELTGEVTLYRLTSHPAVDMEKPGKYYIADKGDLNPDLLDDPSGDLYLITVTCDSSNIDLDESEKECAKLDCDCIVAVKDDTKCEVRSVEPYGKN
jgi:hypothetical protein